MSSAPCEAVYHASVATLSVGSVAGVTALVAFGIYFFGIHRRLVVINNRFDIDSSSWVLAFSISLGLCNASANIANFLCGPTCSATTLSCNTSLGTAMGYFFTALSVLFASIFKIISCVSQIDGKFLMAPRE
jgi:hypothetical protein